MTNANAYLNGCVNAAYRNQGQMGMAFDDVYHRTIAFQDIVQAAGGLLPYKEISIIRA